MRGIDERMHAKPDPSSAISKLTHESVGQFQRHITFKKTRHLPLKVTLKPALRSLLKRSFPQRSTSMSLFAMTKISTARFVCTFQFSVAALTREAGVLLPAKRISMLLAGFPASLVNSS